MIAPLGCVILILTIACCDANKQPTEGNDVVIAQPSFNYRKIKEIPTPAGYRRTMVARDSFGLWLREIRLKNDPRVHLHDGRLRHDQSTQFAVVQMPVGNKNLQQCADAILRLRAEYFFEQNKVDSIRFKATDGTELSFARWLKGERYRLSGNKLQTYMSMEPITDRRVELELFLETVFSYCGTISLGRDTVLVDDFKEVNVGDILVKAGSPGHAMIIVDVALNDKHEKIFMLAQGFMPAQDIHIVKNLKDEAISPWYKVGADLKIVTPQWTFNHNQLKRW